MWFAKEKINDEELKKSFDRMTEQIKPMGGKLTFNLKVDEEGWIAKCKEFDGIITGGTNKNPTQEEIRQALVDAIKTAFHIPIKKLEFRNSKQQLDGLKLPTICLVRELQFA